MVSSSKACVTYLLGYIDLTENKLHKNLKLDFLYTDFIETFDKVSQISDPTLD